jgi:hypothetical protein
MGESPVFLFGSGPKAISTNIESGQGVRHLESVDQPQILFALVLHDVLDFPISQGCNEVQIPHPPVAPFDENVVNHRDAEATREALL